MDYILIPESFEGFLRGRGMNINPWYILGAGQCVLISKINRIKVWSE